MKNATADRPMELGVFEMRALIEGKDFWLKPPSLPDFSFTLATGTERDGSGTNRSQCKTLFGLFAPLQLGFDCLA